MGVLGSGGLPDDRLSAGDIDDVALCVRALTATEVTEHFRAAR